MEFVNRKRELEYLRHYSKKFLVLFGRRRVGKTSLIGQWKGLNHSFTLKPLRLPNINRFSKYWKI